MSAPMTSVSEKCEKWGHFGSERAGLAILLALTLHCPSAYYPLVVHNVPPFGPSELRGEDWL